MWEGGEGRGGKERIGYLNCMCVRVCDVLSAAFLPPPVCVGLG